MNVEINRVVIIGAGNVASHLAVALKQKGLEIVQVWSRGIKNAMTLAQKLGAEATDDISCLVADADLYIFSVVDDALIPLLERFPHSHKNIVHTAGSVGMDVLKPYAEKYGVFYPLQTFSKLKSVDFSQIPLFVESNCNEFENSLLEVANKVSVKTRIVSSEQRRALHIAAVFSCNFTNYLYAVADGYLEENGLSFDDIKPLILETAEKAQTHRPADVQTGPAIRKDVNTMNSHLDLLQDKAELKSLYRELSERIMGKKL